MPKISDRAEFVGRAKDKKLLVNLLANAAEGKGEVIFVSGEAGIGKTRLINELRTEPIGKRFNWLSSRCIFHEGADPYFPFKDALKNWFSTKASVDPTDWDKATEPVGKLSAGPKNISDIPVVGKNLSKEPDTPFGAFLIKEFKSNYSLMAFKALIEIGNKGLCVTRIPPEKLRTLTINERAIVYWLSKKPGEFCIPPSLTKLSHEIINFIRKNPGSTVLLDGLEYIISNNDFKQVLRFINELVDSMALHKGIMLIPTNPDTMDRKQIALIERDMSTIDMTDPVIQNELIPKSEISGQASEDLVKMDIKNGQVRMFESISQQIIDISTQKPLVLFIDDLHWADTGAINLLIYLSRAIKNHPVALLCSYRPEVLTKSDQSKKALELINRMTYEKTATNIHIDRLRKKETAMMIKSLFQNKKFPKELEGFIHAETEGNPFFIEEMLRSMDEDELISFDESKSSWVLTRKISEFKVPDSIKDVVFFRTDRLDKEMHRVLESASVLGVEFEYDILSAVSAIDENQLVTYLDEFIHLTLIKELPCGLGDPVCYRFAHNKICEVLYESLSQSRKRLLHKMTAKAYEDKYQNDLDSVTYELARHYYEGGDYRRSLQYSIDAGEKAISDIAPTKAKTFFLRALEVIELMEARPSEKVSNKEIQAEIYLKLSELTKLTGDWEVALVYTRELLNLSESLNDRWKQTDAHNNEGSIHSHRSEWKNAIEHFSKALELAEKSDYLDGKMRAYYGLGAIHEKKGELHLAMKYYQNFMEIALPMDSIEDIARGYRSFGVISNLKGEFTTAKQYFQECIKLCHERKYYTELAKAYIGLGVTHHELGELDKVIEWNEKVIELCSNIGDIRLKGYGYSNASEVLAKKMELAKALEYANNALDIFTKLDEKPMIGLVFMNFGIIHKNKNDFDKSKHYFEKSISVLKEFNVPYYLADSLRQMGLMLSNINMNKSREEGLKYLEESLGLYEKLGAVKYTEQVRTELEQLRRK